MPLVLFFLTLMGELMVVSVPWLILDADCKTSRGPFKSEFCHDLMIIWLTVCFSQIWVYGQCFTISNSNASKYFQNIFEIKGCEGQLWQPPILSRTQGWWYRGQHGVDSHPNLEEIDQCYCFDLCICQSSGGENFLEVNGKSSTNFIIAPLGLQKQESYAFMHFGSHSNWFTPSSFLLQIFYFYKANSRVMVLGIAARRRHCHFHHVLLEVSLQHFNSSSIESNLLAI